VEHADERDHPAGPVVVAAPGIKLHRIAKGAAAAHADLVAGNAGVDQLRHVCAGEIQPPGSLHPE
jgi:hypothetical protein